MICRRSTYVYRKEHVDTLVCNERMQCFGQCNTTSDSSTNLGKITRGNSTSTQNLCSLNWLVAKIHLPFARHPDRPGDEDLTETSRIPVNQVVGKKNWKLTFGTQSHGDGWFRRCSFSIGWFLGELSINFQGCNFKGFGGGRCQQLSCHFPSFASRWTNRFTVSWKVWRRLDLDRKSRWYPLKGMYPPKMDEYPLKRNHCKRRCHLPTLNFQRIC